jgi:hypothetical protein
VTMLEQGAKRLPLLGQLHLGEKRKTFSPKRNAEVEYPAKLDYFKVVQDNFTSRPMVEAFRQVYGEKPRSIEIMFPSDDEAALMPVDLSAYKQGAGLWCRGPGQHPDGTPGIALRIYDPDDPTLREFDVPEGTRPGEMIQVPFCHTERCPYHANGRDCKLIGRLHFLLPDVPGLGCWRIVTSSWNSVKEIQGGLAFVRQFTGGRIAGIPLTLSVVPREVHHDGKKATVYVLTIAHREVKLRALIEAARKPLEERFLLPEVNPQHDIPTHQFPQAVEPDDDAGDAEAIEAGGAQPEAAPAPPAAPPPQQQPTAATASASAGPPAQGDSAPDPAWVELHDAMADAGWFAAKQRAKVQAWTSQGLTPTQMLDALRQELSGQPAPAAQQPPARDAAQAPPRRQAAAGTGARTRRTPPKGADVGTPSDVQAPPPEQAPARTPPPRRETAPAAGGRPAGRSIWEAM